MKRLNPIIQKQWREDRARRPVYQQRVDEYAALRTAISGYSQQEQLTYVQLLREVCEEETSPEIRRHIALVFSEVPQHEEAVDGLVMLSKDKSEKVRLAVAQGFSRATSPRSTETLLAMAATDKDENVRNIATESLGTHATEDVQAFLTKQLSARQPGVQYAAYSALRKQTGKDFGGDASKMRLFLEGEPVEENPPSFWASPMNYFYR